MVCVIDLTFDYRVGLKQLQTYLLTEPVEDVGFVATKLQTLWLEQFKLDKNECARIMQCLTVLVEQHGHAWTLKMSH